MKLSWAEIVTKNAKLPDPGKNIELKDNINNKTKFKKDTPSSYKKYKNLHTCRWCNQDFEYYDIENHLNEKHKVNDDFTYIFCCKCSSYLKIENSVSKEDSLRNHNAEKHFFKNSKYNYQEKYNKIKCMSAKKLLKEVRNLQK